MMNLIFTEHLIRIALLGMKFGKYRLDYFLNKFFLLRVPVDGKEDLS